MAHHPSLRIKALELRAREGLTIDEIAARLALSRTTVYYWVKGIAIERTTKQNEGQRRATTRMQRRFQEARERAYALGVGELEQLAADPTFRDFVCMYIGEGSKRNRNRVALCNSDPAVIRLATNWIRQFSRNPLRFSVQYHEDQDLLEVRRFWSSVVEAPPEAISLQRKSNSGGLTGRKWRSRHGVLTVTSSDTLLRARLQGWMDGLRASWV